MSGVVSILPSSRRRRISAQSQPCLLYTSARLHAGLHGIAHRPQKLLHYRLVGAGGFAEFERLDVGPVCPVGFDDDLLFGQAYVEGGQLVADTVSYTHLLYLVFTVKVCSRKKNMAVCD